MSSLTSNRPNDNGSGQYPVHNYECADDPERIVMSTLPSEADIAEAREHVRLGPCVDGSGLTRRIFTLQQWSEQPCVRPVRTVPMTAGHNALRGSGPGQKHAFDDAVAQVGCPDRRQRPVLH